MASLQAAAKAQAIALAIERATGERPTISYGPSRASLTWTPDQRVRLRGFMEAQISGKPGDVEIETASIVMPYVYKRAIPYLAGALALGFVAGRMI